MKLLQCPTDDPLVWYIVTISMWVMYVFCCLTAMTEGLAPGVFVSCGALLLAVVRYVLRREAILKDVQRANAREL